MVKAFNYKKLKVTPPTCKVLNLYSLEFFFCIYRLEVQQMCVFLCMQAE